MKNRILLLLTASTIAIITLIAVFQIGEMSSQNDITAQDSWLVECPDCRVRLGGMTDRSLRLDTNDNPHIVFGRDHLHYMYYDGLEWQKEIIDSSPGDKTSVALFLDTEGKEHISYFDNRSYSVKYATRTIGGWQIETVASSLGETGGGTSIAVSPAGVLYISYFDRTTQTLKYATRSSGGWSSQIIDMGLGTQGGNSSLVLDNNLFAHIIYNDYDDQDIKYAYQDSTGWHIQKIDDSGNYPNHSSIDLDTNGYPHISYYSGDMDLNYAYKDGSGWHTQVIDDLDSIVGQWSSIELDQNNYPYISYVSHSGTLNSVLKLSFQAASSWYIEIVDNNGFAGFWSSLALDGNDRPRIAYYGDPFNTDFDLDGDLRYAQLNGNDWHIMALARGGDIGGYNSLALDENDNVHMSYYDGTILYDGDLKYALKAATGWFTETIDYVGNVGIYNTIGIDSNGFPHISYMDSSNQDLKYAYRDSTGWHTELVDSDGDVGYDASLYIDLNDISHIIYRDQTNSALKYAYKDISGWHFENIPTLLDRSGSNTSGRISLAVDAGGYPHFIYNAFGLQYAYKDMAGWHFETIDPCGMEIIGSITLDRDGNPNISYQSCATNLLTYAYRDSGIWIKDTVDSLPYGGYFSSIVLDSFGMPHIGYSPAGYLDVRYAYLDVTGWHTETIPGELAGMITIKLDSLNYPHLAYYDWNHQNLKYATLALTPIAGLTAANNSPTELGQSTLFTATIASGDMVSFTWDFGDGQTGVGAITTHIYPEVGIYTATITAQNTRNVVTATTMVEIVDVPVSGLIATNDSPVLVGATTTLSATVSAGSNVAFTWDFGDGGSGVGALATHIYSTPGEYTARVTARNGVSSQEASTQVIIMPRKIFLPLVESKVLKIAK